MDSIGSDMIDKSSRLWFEIFYTLRFSRNNSRKFSRLLDNISDEVPEADGPFILVGYKCVPRYKEIVAYTISFWNL